MLATAFISWWYGAGWKRVIEGVKKRLDRTLLSFSLPTLLRTLFAPWKRITTAPGSGIDAMFRAAVDNFISRLVGFTVRFSVLIAAGICLGVIAVAGVLQVILWPLLPVLIAFCVVMGIR